MAIKGMYDIEEYLDDRQKESIRMVESIINANENTIDEVRKDIEKSTANKACIYKCIECAISIRLKQRKILFPLFIEFAKKYRFLTNEKTYHDIKEALYFNKLLKYSLPYTFRYKSMENIIEIFQKGTIERAIMDDDYNTFVTLTAFPDFNYYQRVSYKMFGAARLISKRKDLTLMQMMALFRSVNCFKISLASGHFDESELEQFAIAGGNLEIIKILEQRGSSFDRCFCTAVIFHHTNLCNWLKDNYACDFESTTINSISFFNPRAFYFLTMNELVPIDEMKDNIALIAAQYSNVELVRYMVNKYQANIMNSYSSRSSALECATYEGDLELTRYLIEEYHADPKKISFSAMQNAAFKGNLEFLKYLVEKCGRSVEESNIEYYIDRGKTYHLAARMGRLNIIKYCVEECHIDIESRDSNGKTVLGNAIKSENIELIDYLVNDCHANIKNITRGVVADTFYKNNTMLTKYLIEKCNVSTKIHCCNDYTLLHYSIEKNNLELVKYLIETCKIDTSRESENYYDGETPLHVAVRNNNFEMTKYIINNIDVDIEAEIRNGNKTALFIALEKGNLEIAKYLIETCHANITERDIEIAGFISKKYLYSIAELYKECEDGNLENCKQIMSKEKIYIEQTFNGETVLSIACKKGHKDLIKYFIEECGADVNNKVIISKVLKTFTFPLHIAIKNGNIEVARMLIEKYSANIDVKDSSCATILHVAAKINDLPFFKYLVEDCHMDAHAKNNKGETALFYATKKNNKEISSYLINKWNIDVNEKNENGRTILHNVCREGYFELAKYLIEECHANPEVKDNGGKTVLHYAIKKNKFHMPGGDEKVDKFSAEYIITRLSHTSKNSNIELIKYLIDDCHLDAGAADNKGRTAIYFATKNGDISIVKYLVDHCNVDLEVMNDKGKTPFCNATKNCDIELIKYLLFDHKVNPETSYRRACNVAISLGNTKLLDLLINHCCCEIDYVDPEQLCRSLEASGSFDTINYLIDREYIDLDVSTLNGVVSCGDIKLTKYFIEEKGISPFDGDEEGDTPLHIAASKGYIDIVKYLVEKHHADIYAMNELNLAPYHMALSAEKLDTIKYFVENCGVDVHVKDNKGFTSLHYAILNNNLDVVKYFVEMYSVDVKATDSRGKTALDMAKDRNFYDIAEYLEKKENEFF